MEKNPSILRFGSLSVKVITRFSKQEASSYALLARWRRPRKHSTTTLATGASPRWSGITTMETRRRCRPLDLHRYLKISKFLHLQVLSTILLLEKCVTECFQVKKRSHSKRTIDFGRTKSAPVTPVERSPVKEVGAVFWHHLEKL